MPRVSVSDVMFLNAPSVMRATNSPVLELELLEKSAVNTLHGLRPNHSSTVFNVTNSALDGASSTGITAESSLKNTSKSSESIITFSKNTLANTATKAYSNSSSNLKNSKIAYNTFTKAFNKESLSSISTAEPFKYYMTDLTDISFYDPYLEVISIFINIIQINMK